VFEIIITESYEKKGSKIFKKHPDLKEKYVKVVTIFKTNPLHPSLSIHKLTGKKREYFSISLDMNYRMILDFIVEDKKIILLDIGSHGEIYK